MKKHLTVPGFDNTLKGGEVSPLGRASLRPTPLYGSAAPVTPPPFCRRVSGFPFKLTAMAAAALAAALGLILAACANPFISPLERKSGSAEGTGLVRIGTGAGAARTALPDAAFHHLEYLFAFEGGSAQPITPVTPGGAEYELSSGDWVVTINAYAGAGSETLAATGSEPFTVAPGTETDVMVSLSPLANEGTGTLKVSLRCPAGARVRSLSMTRLADTEDIDLVPDEGSAVKTVTVNAGYYLAGILMERGGITAGKTEIVHIYANLTTNLVFEFVESDFSAILVFSSADSGEGSLREAIANAPAGATIVLDPPAGDRVIALRSALVIDKSLSILGCGTTVTPRSGFAGALVNVSGSSSVVAISRIHFKGGRNNAGTDSDGGAIRSTGRLTLESCVFSDNRIVNATISSRGGAIYSTGTLTVLGSTFHGNSAGAGQGGAIYRAGGTMVLQGNLFWENTAASYGVVGPNSGVTSLGFNVSNLATGTDAARSGFSHADDAQAPALPFSFVSFKPLAGRAAAGIVVDRPVDYPVVDFYGTAIPEQNAAAGAAQDMIADAGSMLQYAAWGPGSVEIKEGTVDPDGFTGGSVTLRAVPANTAFVTGAFEHWIVDGTEQGQQSPPEELVLPMGGDAAVLAVFSGTYTVSSGADGGPESLREALNMVNDGDFITLQGQTITLATPLPQIDKSLVILGNGATLTQSGFTESGDSQLLYINSAAEVSISRLHFKGGRAANYGAAIYNNGKLTLESCVLSDNRTSNQSAYGGAIYTAGVSSSSLTLSGCTFAGNAAGTDGPTRGGAIYVGGSSGTLTLTGNLFWGNTARNNSVVYYPNGTVTSNGYNVSDKDSGTGNGQSGWVFNSAKGDSTAAVQPFHLANFRPLSTGAAYQRIDTKPSGYPAEDFYGAAIPENKAMAGAVQDAIVSSGYILDYEALGSGRVEAEGTTDYPGMYSGSVTLTAITGSNGAFKHWTVGGVVQPAQEPPNVLTLTMDGHKTVRAVIITTWTVSSSADTGDEGTLRHALNNAFAGDYIVFQSGLTVTLTTPLPAIDKSLSIEGNGATLTQTGFTEGSDTQLLRIANSSAEVRISRLHFTGGRAANNGAAIYNTGNLTLESCIFSRNLTSNASAYGGAIYTGGSTIASLAVSGCTFAGNTAGTTGGRGGAVYRNNGTVTLTGNLFWANTASVYGVVYGLASVSSGGYNVSDKAAGESGWTFVTGDIQAAGQPIYFANFSPLSTGEAYQRIDTRPADYPALDFNWTAIPESNAMAGAVQDAIVSHGYMLNYEALGSGLVQVTAGSADTFGLYAGSVTLTATPSGGASFIQWIVNGTPLPAQTPPHELILTMNGHKTVQGIFAATWTVSSSADTDDEGTLRHALNNAPAGAYILLPANQTITLAAPLPAIDKSVTIEGNGATLTQTGFTEGGDTQLLRVANGDAEVRISRLHFTGGRATDYGAAIHNNGKLTLESCIFSDNATSNASATGGAIYTGGANASLTVSGCTFAGNTAGTTGGRGGAIFRYSGTLTLTGNLFWGNTANSFSVINGGVSSGYNVSDKAAGESGWAFVTGDIQAMGQPLDTATFQPLSNGAAYQRIGAKPAGYPAADFNGTGIPANNAMAGAVQTAITASGYGLNYGEATGPGTITLTEGAPNAYGLYEGSVTLTAEPAGSDDIFLHWIVNGVVQPDQPTPDVLILSMDGDKTVSALFAAARRVTSGLDSGAGSLREALTSPPSGTYIVFDPGLTVTLTDVLPAISTNLVILGNGSTLTQSGFTAGTSSQLLSVTGSDAEVRISRLRFTGGLATGRGAAIYNAGKLTLESCIFSDNTVTTAGQGGAIYTSGAGASLSVSGCTFSGNVNTATTTSAAQGGAIYQNSGTLTLTGNLFWGDTAASYPVVRPASATSVTSNGYNVSDKAGGTTASGWTFVTGDIQAASLPFYLNFRPFATGAAYQRITTTPEGYPSADFYGDPIPPSNAMAGAIQRAITSTGYGLDYAPVGRVAVTAGGPPDFDGFYTGSVTLEATPAAGSSFIHWTVDGEAQPPQTPPNELTLVMDHHTIVRAVFAVARQVTSGADDGAGTLREAVTNAASGDYIVFDPGLTVTLTAPLPQITKSLTIEGNGSTLFQSGFTESDTSQLLYINSTTAEVRISRLHFKGGRARDYGAAIRNVGILTLESCIFSDNVVSKTMAYGGAIYTTTGSLTVLGCTFTKNTASTTSSRGGAIYRASGTLTLMGNIFVGNNSGQYPVVYHASPGATTGGYNVSDKASGTTATLSGWTFKTSPADAADVQLTELDFDDAFSPSSATGLPVIPSLPAGFPATYFDGTPRGTTPGAMPEQSN